jgi:hypothetical protein
MDDRPAFRAFPFRDQRAGPFIVFADGAVGNGIKVSGVDRHPLPCFRGAVARDLLELSRALGGVRRRGPQQERERKHFSRQHFLFSPG